MKHITDYRIDKEGLWVKIKGYWYEIGGTELGPLRDGFIAMIPEKSDAPIFKAIQFYDEGGFIMHDHLCANPEIVREAFHLLSRYWQNPGMIADLLQILDSDPPAWRWAKEFPISLECPKYFHNANLYKISLRRHHA